MSSIVLDFFGPFYDDDKLAKLIHEDLLNYTFSSKRTLTEVSKAKKIDEVLECSF
ncbi:hypothetical protein JCM21142_93703 [Saccharicrinis fermentans DSM 9555 = JCM 21142]|uniref:Uncharacterized protein n=1 Tax=Saccharicrinis fermentans DSM 9555 = JCM 21142 TaxID=869213 RepID=W7Y297_9BACT|nr:hypothetical protein JCM21142_93703 [Saccharicrinis fermentans DSM 9555 = JCM 21142]